MKAATAVLSAALALACARTAAAGDDVADLIRRADMAYRGDTSAGVFEMTVKTASYERTYSVVVWADDRDGKDRALVKILGPAMWRGFGTLKVGDRLKLFNPKTNHVTVVGAAMLGESWMGSHFTNDDLVKETQLHRHYRAKLVKTWTADAPLGAGTKLYRIELSPKPTAPVAWARIVYTLAERGDAIVPVRADYFRKPGDARPARTMTFSDVGPLGGRILPRTVEVRVADKPGEFTRITYKKLALGVRIPDSKFTEQALRR
ncbi:MAG: outer membrane lipoprotein-sorting protein [Deltaproteobacteria bacterium]|nr:MAG: outer membrane lipoprotein-sorting protein [Deltaproteobacteria bacterium]